MKGLLMLCKTCGIQYTGMKGVQRNRIDYGFCSIDCMSEDKEPCAQCGKKLVKYENEKVDDEPAKRKRGRPHLTPEKIELKQTMKEIELQKQLLKLEKKIESTAKHEAKKKVLTKIKQKLEEDHDSDVNSDSDDDSAINQIIAKHKKPIVIVNKIERDPKKKKPTYEQPQPMAYFI